MRYRDIVPEGEVVDLAAKRAAKAKTPVEPTMDPDEAMLNDLIAGLDHEIAVKKANAFNKGATVRYGNRVGVVVNSSNRDVLMIRFKDGIEKMVRRDHPWLKPYDGEKLYDE